MVTVEELQKAIQRLYATDPPRKALKLKAIREVIACYLCITTDQISEVMLKTALRKTDFALPKPKLRNRLGEEPVIDWAFVPRFQATVAITPSRKFKDKPVAASLKMKAS